MKQLIELLHREQCACVIGKAGEYHLFRERGVTDLYRLFNTKPQLLEKAAIADKVVGKAAATLMILGGIEELYTDIISIPALRLFKETTIKVSFKQQVDHIKNRTQTDWCPLEKTCFKAEDIETIYPLIKAFYSKPETI